MDSHFRQGMPTERAPELVLDMSGVNFLDSAGIGALAQLFVHRERPGAKVRAALTQQARR